ncbi:MAG: SGNH/GDSL hydrolase family protein [Eubacterium sp.]
MNRITRLSEFKAARRTALRLGVFVLSGVIAAGAAAAVAPAGTGSNAYAAARRVNTRYAGVVALPELPVKHITDETGPLHVKWDDNHACDVYVNGRLKKADVVRGGWRGEMNSPSTSYHVVVKRESDDKEVLNDIVTERIGAPCVRNYRGNLLRWYKVDGAAKYLVYKTVNGVKRQIASTSALQCRVSGNFSSLTLYAVTSGGQKSDATTFKPSSCKSYRNVRTLIEGDSITCPVYGYADYAASRLGMDYNNSAVSGSLLSYSDGSKVSMGKSVYTRLMNRSDLSQYKLIIISAGINDYLYQIPLGTPSSGSDTFIGAYYKIARLLTKETHARVILVMPQESYQGRYRGYSTTHKNKYGYTVSDERAAIQKLAKKYHFSVFTPTVLNQSNVQSLTLDNLHPNRATQIKIGKQFQEYLENTAN